MENASKALIIAGAVLISILLVTVGVIMFQKSKGTTDQAEGTTKLLENGAKSGVDSINSTLNQITF